MSNSQLNNLENTIAEIATKIKSYAQETKWNPTAIKGLKELLIAHNDLSNLHMEQELIKGMSYISRFPQQGAI